MIAGNEIYLVDWERFGLVNAIASVRFLWWIRLGDLGSRVARGRFYSSLAEFTLSTQMNCGVASASAREELCNDWLWVKVERKYDARTS